MNTIFCTDFNGEIIKYLDNDFGTLKKLAETSKDCHKIVNDKSNFKYLLQNKINNYNCDMVESYILKILRPHILNYKDEKMPVYEERLVNYIKKLNNESINILYNKIDYCYNERNIGLNNYIQELCYMLSRKLFDIMKLIEDNLNLNDEDITNWLNIKY